MRTLEPAKTFKVGAFELLSFLIVNSFFTMGAAFGYSFSSVSISEISFLSDFSLASSLLNVLLFPVFSFVIGYFVFGFAILPLSSFAYGFLISFSSGVLLRAGEFRRYYLCCGSRLVSAAVFILIASFSFRSSLSLFLASVNRGAVIPFSRKKLFLFLLACAAVCAAAALEFWVSLII